MSYRILKGIHKMGEKIRDVRPVSLIGADLMVELNEGYTKSQGRVIHIQNKQFRYLLTEQDFYQIASDIMRAAVELHYIKTHLPKRDIRLPQNASGNNISIEDFEMMTELLKQKIEYRIIELRDNILTIIVSPDNHKRFAKFAKQVKAKRLEHPYGKRHGYRYLYQMREFEIYKFHNRYYEVIYQLPCKSLTPKMWMPLDKCVQNSIWNDKKVINGYTYISDEELWIYRITKCMFMQIYFSDMDKNFFEEHRELLTHETLLNKMKMIVFDYAQKLIEHMITGEYDSIIAEYFSYTDY